MCLSTGTIGKDAKWRCIYWAIEFGVASKESGFFGGKEAAFSYAGGNTHLLILVFTHLLI